MEAKRLWPGGPLFLEAEHMRLTTDSILLASFASVRAGERGADLGCASGALMLLLLVRTEGLRMTGFELLPEAVRLAEENFRLNGMAGRTELFCGDLRETVGRVPKEGFDFVISNPPFFSERSGKISPDADRAAARTETKLRLEELCHAASQLCRSGGRGYFCCRPERLFPFMQAMRDARLEPKRLCFVHHSRTAAASLALIEGRRDGRSGLKVERPFLIRDDSGQETEEYRKICHIE